MYQGSVLSPLLYAVVIGVVTELARGVVSKLHYAGDLAMMSETIEGLKNKFRKRTEVF